MKLRVLDLFSGIGGFSLGLERTGGFETVAFCEIEKFPRRVLKKHWPEVPCFEDITTSDFGSIGPVDMVTAGFPCQDISLAGKGAGLAGERSGLFWHILRTVRMVGRPKLLLENVAALLDRGMGSVLGALASVGYDAEWHCIPASAVGAPHRRDRLWIVGNPNNQVQSDGTVNDEAPKLQTMGSDPNKSDEQRKQRGFFDAKGWPGPISGQIRSLLDGLGGVGSRTRSGSSG